jgi:DNA polymerase III sliding clamp (beta) subunit (PCNA family)
MKNSTLTEDKAEQTSTGGVLVGKREGQTIIHNKGTLSGYLVGKTHAEGGIKAVNKSTGQPLEMQGGEVVITAPAVSDNTKREFEGKMMTNREILSTINEKGGGVAFAKDGMEIPKSIKHTGASYKYGGKTMTDHEIMMKINGGHLAEGYSLREIASIHQVPLSELKKQVRLGMKAESEHTPSKREQMKIVKDHLFENPKYYTLLKKAGLESGGDLISVNVVESKNQKNSFGNNLPLGDKRFDIKSNNKIVGHIVVGSRWYNEKSTKPDYYEVVKSFVKDQNKGIGTKAYIKLIAILDKPLHSDMVRTPQAESVWKKLEKLNLAKKSKDDIGYESFANGGQTESLVKDAKSGNTPARDLNNYNDVLDIDADGMVGAETSLYADGGLIAPNGHKTNLTPKQYKLVRTPEFKAWFGDWENDPENASKVVDENGEPLVVYHGTYVENPFYIFDFDKADLGFHFGTYEQAKNRSETKLFFKGRKSIVNSFFLNIKTIFESTDIGEWEYPQRYIDMFVSDGLISESDAKKNGFYRLVQREENKQIREYLLNKYGKFGGFVYNNKYEGKGNSFIVLNPNQIKLADGSNTTFDSSNPDIRYELGGIFHGSPYNFDKFTTSKMGSGIGQQEDGWGIYLTDKKEATKNYGKYIYETTLFKNKSLGEYNFIDLKKPVKKDIVTKIVKAVYKKYNKDFDIIEFNQYYDYVKDKSLPKVDFNDYELIEFDYSGFLFYKTLSRVLGGDKNASLFLLDNGIDGLKRSLENSKGVFRTDYVIFDENAITIENKEYLPNNYYADGGKVGVETILFAVRKGEPDWNEVLITNNPDKIEDAKKWALANGFDRLRVSKIDMMEKPDFKKTFADGGKVDKARYRIIDSNGRVKYTGGTEMGSWFTLEKAKELVNYSNGEMIYEYDNNGDRLYEVFATGGMFNTEPFLNYYFDEIAEFLKYQNNITLNKDFTFKYKGGLFRVEPIVLSEKNIKEAYFSIIDSDNDEVGDIVFNPNNNKKFEANSDFFDWNNIKFYDGGDVKPYDANMEGDSADMMFAEGGAVNPIITNWNDVPSIWKNTSKVKKVAFTNSPYDKGLYSIVAPFLGKDDLRPIMSGINFDENGITVTNAHVLITLPYPSKEFEGVYEADLSKRASSDQITIDGNYPNYPPVIPKKEVTKPFLIDVYKLLQYNDVAMKFANKITNAVNYKIEDEIAGFNAKFLNESLKTLLKLGHDKAYAHYIAPNKALLLSPSEDYEIGNDELVLTMPVMVQNQSYGAIDIDYGRGLKVYYDFNDNEIHNADGSIAEFKMTYENNSIISKEDVTLLEKLANGKNRLAILNYVLIENGIARASDLDSEYYLSGVDLPNGVYKTNKGALEITMEATEDYPRSPIFVADEDTLQFVISSNILEYYIDKLKYVVGQDDLRPVMQGICLHHTSDNKLFLAGTDAHILLRVNITEYVDMPVYNKDMKFIIQPKRLYDFLNSTENTALTIKSNLVATSIQSDNWSFYARNIDGNYPNYDAVMPRETTKLAVVNLEPIKKAFSSEMVKNYVKEAYSKDKVFIFNKENEIFIATGTSADNIQKICDTNIDFSVKDYYNNSQSVLLFMPFGYDKQTNFAFRKDLVERVSKIVNHNKLELHYTELNRPYLIPIDSFDYKTTTKEYKVREQKPSVAEIKLVSTINEVSEIKEAIETLEMLSETATRKDKKEINEAIEVLQMLLDTYEY